MQNPLLSPGKQESRGTIPFHRSHPSCIATYRAHPNNLPSLWFLVLGSNQKKVHNSSISATKGNPICYLLSCNTHHKNKTTCLNSTLSFSLIFLHPYEKVPHKAFILHFPKCVKRKRTRRVTFALQVPSWAGICSCPSAQVFCCMWLKKLQD